MRQRESKVGLEVAKAKGVKLGRKIDEKERAKLLAWNAKKVPVKVQAKRLGLSLAAVYAMMARMKAMGIVE